MDNIIKEFFEIDYNNTESAHIDADKLIVKAIEKAIKNNSVEYLDKIVKLYIKVPKWYS